MIVAYDKDGQAVMQFNDTTEAGIWAELPTQDIEQALRGEEYLHGFLYREKEGVECPRWDTMGQEKVHTKALHALTMVSKIDKDDMVYDANQSEILSAEDIYSRYFKPLTTREIFEAMLSSVRKKHAIMNRMDEEKKELGQLVISQAPTNKKGESCIYIPFSEAKEFLEDAREVLGIEGEIIAPAEEGYIGRHNGACIFVVEELRKPYTIEQWRGDLNKSK